MRKYDIAIIILLISGLCAPACFGQYQQDSEEILRVLELQKEAWNRGDLEGYMAYYWKSAELTFQSDASRVRGWATLIERYQKSYSGEKMGQLDFSDIEVNVLSKDCAYVLGRWSVTVQDEKKGGVFTLILKRFPEGWRIIHDHTS